MRLHRLQVQAFGPFAAVETVDFDAVAAAGLYLIQGATGAGKTSILDAICYAVYGAVPGSRTGHRGSIRSDHADPLLAPRVVLEFTAAGDRLRITRSPEWDAPKKRGSGTTRRPATVVLEILRGAEWVAQSTRIDEAAEIVTDHLGLGMEQFAQVVLLPQGEFASFLRAKPEERSALLRRLFDIERFADAQQWLADRKRALSDTVHDADLAIALHGERLTTVLAESDLPAAPSNGAPQVPASDLPGSTLLATIGECRALAVDRATQALVDADGAAEDRDIARDARLRAETTLQWQLQATEARATLAAYEQRHAARELELSTVRAARRAAVIRPVATHRLAVAEVLATAEGAARTAERMVVELVDTDCLVDGQLHRTSLQTAVELGSSTLDVLADLAAQHATAAAAVVLHSKASLAAHERSLAAHEATVRLQATIDDVERELAALCTDVSVLQDARRSVEVHRVALHTGRTLADARVLQTAAEQQAKVSRSRFASAEQQAIDLRQARLSGMIGEIGAGLTRGCPCPVCGSTEHPAPAAPPAGAAAEQDVVRAEAVAVAARQALSDADAAFATARGSHAERATAHRAALDALDTLPGTLDDDALQGALSSAQATLTRVEATRSAFEALSGRLAELTGSATSAQQSCTSADYDLGLAEARHAESRTVLATLEARALALREQHTAQCCCDRVDRGDPIDRHTRLVPALRDLHQADLAVRLAAAADRQSAAELTEILASQGFSDLSQAQAALLDLPQMAQIENRIAAEQTANERATGILEQPQLIAAERSPKPDIAALEEAAQASDHRHRAAVHAVSGADRAVHELDRIATSVQLLVTGSSTARADLAVLGPLAETASGQGDNTLRMRLTSYVLAARLESVTALANERLAVMSDGRFTLEHSDELAKAGARSGLGLRVLDSWTGRSRDTATLSGGEAFIASLALALGLGDAVLQDAGGRPLESLFVDEGFGSLDEQTLDQVMSVLDTLRSGGRSVGIVSHVAELRHRIQSTIDVVKTESGSHIRAHAVA
ncbi:AAA family ATPase [Dermatophilaceae bacterium Sec6.4]